MPTKNTTLFASAVDISTEYLGPAGERFMRRQISTHLNIDPENIQKKDFEELVEWVRLTFAVLTDDMNNVNDFANKLMSLVSGDNTSYTNHPPARNQFSRLRGTGKNGHSIK